MCFRRIREQDYNIIIMSIASLRVFRLENVLPFLIFMADDP